MDLESQAAQWIRIHLPVQGTRAQSLVQEDSTCRSATKPVHPNYRALVLKLLKPESLELVLCNEKLPQ